MTKTGAGTLTLSGENSYSGGTDLKEGRVAVRQQPRSGHRRARHARRHDAALCRRWADLANPIAFTDAVDPIVDTGPFTATLTGAITGPGDLSKIGSGTLILSGANTYTGATAVTEGTLRAGVSNTFSPASAHSVAAGATLDLAGFSQTRGGPHQRRHCLSHRRYSWHHPHRHRPLRGQQRPPAPGHLPGRQRQRERPAGPQRPRAAASGNTTVQVVNLGGLGALTTGNGIELVSAINGATTTAQSTKDAFALQGGHVDAGAYRIPPAARRCRRCRRELVPALHQHHHPARALQYSPAPAKNLPHRRRLFLLCRLQPRPPIQVPTYRAEVPLFAALPEQLRQSNLAMLGNLHQRIGDDDMKTAAGAKRRGDVSQPAERRAWGRVAQHAAATSSKAAPSAPKAMAA